jgi:archaellum biogenesis ATPase FlaH
MISISLSLTKFVSLSMSIFSSFAVKGQLKLIIFITQNTEYSSSDFLTTFKTSCTSYLALRMFHKMDYYNNRV